MSHATVLAHAAALQQAARARSVRASIQLEDFTLRLTRDDQAATWKPQFITWVGGRLAYSAVAREGTVGFAGWQPYPVRQWDLATDKIAFKHHVVAHGVATPAACFDPARIGGPFLIKSASSSFGQGIRGPYLAYDASEPDHQLREREYYESFLVGQIAKAWCWGRECVALHLHAPTIVTGDGKRTVRELVTALPNTHGGRNDWDLVGRLSAYCGVESVDVVLAEGKECLVEFRYGSRYQSSSGKIPDLIQEAPESALAKQFKAAARVLAEGIRFERPKEGTTYFSLDAVVDAQGRAWFLEMNCNPVVHPGLYGWMVGEWVGVR